MESVQFAVSDRFAKQNPQATVKFLRAVVKAETVNRPRYVIEYVPERVMSWKGTHWASRYL